MGKSKGKIEKPSFLRSYLISAVVVLLITSVFVGFMLILEHEIYKKDFEVARMRYDEELKGFLENMDYEMTPAESVKIKKRLVDMYSNMGVSIKLIISRNEALDYFEQEPDVEIDSSRTAILSAYGYTLEIADKKYLDYFDRPDIDALSYNFSYYTTISDAFVKGPRTGFVCSEFYADFENKKFIPVEAEILTGECPCAGKAELSGVKVSIKPDPKDIEGFTLMKSNAADSIRSGEINLDDEDLHYAEIAGSSAEELNNMDLSVDYRYWNMYYAYITYESRPEYSRIWDTCKKNTVWGVVIIVSALALAFIPASIGYNNKMRKYQIFEYRRKMTDAMAHDLKTPMAAVTAYAENITNHIGTDKQEHYAEKIGEKVGDMNKLVNNILDFSRSEATDLKLKSEEVDVAKMIGEILADNEAGISERSLDVNFAPSAVSVTTDPELFRQALANLISNAVLHSKAGTVVDISCSDRSVVIVNTAAGKIEDPGSLKQAFVKGSSSRGSRGSGLGLAIADNDLAMLGFKLKIRTEEDKFIATVKM